ncbi:uba ts-n domain protein [Ophiostoma piceae UAMH 11346]|uniref:Uba ts-n domain protein n=1 Tax=Ophiostoma piceae (strain UAMH 11346) TaxID=1262450 RepID=S3CRE6_OPHP1|nr:uba ts-n domain protein [Ophiostoma piceae UAMH 11346]
MDDLSGLDWSSASKQTTSKPTLAAQSSAFGSGYSSYPSLRPTPPPQTTALSGGSGRNTPLSLSNQGSGAAARSTANTTSKAQDSFSGLVNFGNSSTKTANLSLREQQERLNAEKRRKEEEQRKLNQANYGNSQFFDALGRGQRLSSAGASRTNSPSLAPPGAGAPISRGSSPLGGGRSGDDDLFAAFNADTQVDKSSHFPPPTTNNSGKSTPANAALDLGNPNAWGAAATKPAAAPTSNNNNDDDDDDPFGLNQFQAKATLAPVPASTTPFGDDGDDFLGDLAKPVEEVRRQKEAQEQEQRRQREQQRQQQEARQRQQRRQQRPEPGKPIEGPDSDSDSETGPRAGSGSTGNPQFDRAVAELVDYGFSVEDARRGLTESGGLNVQVAVNFLLDDAHRKAKEKQKGGRGGAGGEEASRPSRNDNRSPATSVGVHPSGEDFAKTAAAVGTSLFKTANSLWKTGQKQLQKAVQDFQLEGGDTSQPKWMRSVQEPGSSAGQSSPSATDEAMMLESGARPERRQGGGSSRTHGAPASNPAERFRNDSQPPSRTQSPAAGGAPVPRWQNASDPRSRLTKQAIEEESAQVYVSPARRRKAQTPSASAASTPPPEPKSAFDAPPEADLLSNSTALPQRPAQRAPPPSRSANGTPALSSGRAPPSAMPTPRPVAVARKVPPVNSFALKASAKHRADGAAHFKRGDYAAAHSSYAASLTDIPNNHPLLAVLYCNRALTALKTGEPRQAVADADLALSIIGPSRGEGESVDLEDGSGTKRDLKDMYGKALTRKAEALEQMEKWSEAGSVWQQCVESGIGGATAIAGRQRCQTAVKPKPAAARPPSKPAAKPVSRPSAVSSLSGTSTPVSASGRDFEAVKRLREAHAAAAREDTEKMELVDAVDARIAAWRDGKRDNIRALLGSMDKVLWDGSGWKTIGLHELVMPNKVKINYMKAIAKTHPDKIAPDASTEVRMIAGSVFATLNESWDKFKADNKM